MRKILNKWIDRYFSDEEAIFLFVLMLAGAAVILLMGGVLIPVFASIILAFLFQGALAFLKQHGVPHLLAVAIVFALFVSFVVALSLFVLPLAWKQLSMLFNELPQIIGRVQNLLLLLPQKYPEFFSEQQIRDLINSAAGQVSQAGQWLLTVSLHSVGNIVTWLVYLILVPILVFFFLKDGDSMLASMSRFLPQKRQMMKRIWAEMDDQIANYIRGKAIEILIVGGITWVTFAILQINYAALLALMVGLSVLIPYIGATLATLPVALIGYFQWGWSSEFMWIMVAYGIIQTLDGNVLVPLLFSEAVNLHPVAIIVSVLVFGSLWGFWGVFFAIPLATLVKAIFNAWPHVLGNDDSGGEAAAPEEKEQP